MFYIYEPIHNSDFETNPCQIKDNMNLCFQHIKVLTEVKGYFSMSHLGTLNNENLFSTTKYMTYGDELSIVNKNPIQKIIAIRY